MRALFVALLLLPFLLAAPARAGADPRALNLRLGDLPAGFARTADTLTRKGAAQVSQVHFSRRALAGLLEADSTLTLYPTAAAAMRAYRASYARGVALGALTPLRIAPVGQASSGWTYTDRAGPLPATSYLANWVRGRAVVLLMLIGVDRTYAPDSLAPLDRAIDARIRAAH